MGELLIVGLNELIVEVGKFVMSVGLIVVGEELYGKSVISIFGKPIIEKLDKRKRFLWFRKQKSIT